MVERSNWIISIVGIISTSFNLNVKNRVYYITDATQAEATGRATLAFKEENKDCPINIITPLDMKSAANRPLDTDFSL